MVMKKKTNEIVKNNPGYVVKILKKRWLMN
ncbi:Uncharacterised protein [Escherichia coli]|uniref:Uncharacterized protein n=1 Tax=Escherichia coli TaxID=562 RepID=A0A377E378_ECOLX|nr:Uncharacterised protein [Escherichia coli]